MAGGALERWKRTWWVFLPLASLGLLAFVPLAIAGKKARRRDWLVWSFVYAFAAWGALSLRWFGDEETRSVTGLLFLVAIGGFTHALVIRRPFLEATGAVEASLRDSDENLRIWGARIGAGAFVVGFFALATGASALAVGAAAAFGLGFFGLSAMLAAPSRHALPILRDGRLVFAYRVWGVRAGGAGFLSLGIALVLVSGAGPSGFDRVMMLVGAAFISVPAGLILRAARDPHLSLTQEGISAHTTFSKTAVPWEIVTELGLFSHGPLNAIGVQVSDPERVWLSRLDRINQSFEFRTLPDVVYPARQLETDPVLVVETLRHYWKHPEDRRELGTPASIGRFERALEAAGDLSADPA